MRSVVPALLLAASSLLLLPYHPASSTGDPQPPPALQSPLPCNRPTTDSVCLNETNYAHCFENNMLGPAMLCGTGTICKQFSVIGVTRVYCGWPSVTPGGYCDRNVVDTICIARNAYSHCYADSALSTPHMCPANTVCTQTVVNGVTRVACTDPKPPARFAIRDLDGLALRDLASDLSAGEFDTPIPCSQNTTYNVCLNSTAYAQCQDDKLTAPMPCGEGTVCKSQLYGNMTGVVCDWPSNSTASSDTTNESSTDTSAESPIPSFSTDDTEDPLSKDDSEDLEDPSSTEDSDDTEDTEDPSSTEASVVQDVAEDDNTAGYPQPGDACVIESTHGKCVGTKSFSLCASGNVLSEPTKCGIETSCKETVENNKTRAYCWWDAPDDGAVRKPGDECSRNTTDSVCLTDTAFAKCIETGPGTGMLGQSTNCGDQSVCKELVADGITRVVCGHDGVPARLARRERTGEWTRPEIEAYHKIVVAGYPTSRSCEPSEVNTICYNETTFLQCQAPTAVGGVTEFGNISPCGAGTVCYNQPGRVLGVFCGWPSTTTDSSTTSPTTSSTTTTAAPKLLARQPVPPTLGFSKPGDTCNINAIDSLCFNSTNFGKCLDTGVLSSSFACGEGTSCVQLIAGKEQVLRVFCGYSTQPSRINIPGPTVSPAPPAQAPSPSPTPLAPAAFVYPRPKNACNSAVVDSLCVSVASLSACSGNILADELPCGAGTVCLPTTIQNGKASAYCGWPKDSAGAGGPPAPLPPNPTPNGVCNYEVTNSKCMSKTTFALCGADGKWGAEMGCRADTVCKSTVVANVERVFCGWPN